MTSLKRRDLVLIGLIAVFALAWLLVIKVFFTDTGSVAEVTVDGKIYGTYELTGDYTIDITQDGEVTNTLHVSDGAIYMESADCPDKLCIKQGKLKDTSKSIVCLPNKVVVTISKGAESGLDSTTY